MGFLSGLMKPKKRKGCGWMARPAVVVREGDRFGDWTVIKEAGPRKDKRYFECECVCGTVKEVQLTSMRQGTSTNCGCRNPKLMKLNDLTGQRFGFS